MTISSLPTRVVPLTSPIAAAAVNEIAADNLLTHRALLQLCRAPGFDVRTLRLELRLWSQAAALLNADSLIAANGRA